MIHSLFNGLSILAALAVIVRCVCIAAHLSRKDFAGHMARFYVLAASYAISAGGALAAIIAWHFGLELMLIGMAGFFLAERRLAGKPC